jgi:hypothetical protein
VSAGRAGVVNWPAPRVPGFWSGARMYATATLSSIVLAFLVVAGGSGPFLRLLTALVIALVLTSLALTRPAAGVVSTFVYLVFMELLRRVMIPASSWLSTDPLLLVGPAVSVILLVKVFALERRQLAPDLISVLISILLLVTFLEVGNPTGYGIGSNLAGLLYMATPLFWFYVGRELLNDELSDRLLAILIVLGLVVGAYGLYQTQVGDPPWDVNWLNTTGGYNALNVGNTVRAFGTFASSAEYSLFLGSGLAAAVGFALRGRTIALAAVPLLGVCLFLSSGRSPLITAFAAVVVMLGLRTHRPMMAVIITIVAAGGAYGGLKAFSSSLSSSASGSSALVSHQLGGLTDPLNPTSSTLLLHLTLVEQGVKSGVTHVIGRGPGVTNNAAGVGGKSTTQATQATEVDISNAFVGLGIVGGVLYLVIVLMVLWNTVTSYFAGREAVLPVIGVLIAGVGQWLIGGDYMLSPFTWLLIGAAASSSAGRVTARRGRHRASARRAVRTT